MIAFDTPIPVAWIAIGAIAAMAIMAWVWLGLRSFVRPRYLAGLAGLRLWACVAVLLLLLNPYRLDEKPDADGFRVAVLFDASGSMDTRDIAGGNHTRFDLVTEWINEEGDSPVSTLRQRGYRLDISLFSEESVPFSGGEPRLLPGGTALGTVLQQELPGRSGTRADLGAVLLVSDGQSNVGPSPIEAAREYRALGIPVSSIGVGSRTAPGEVRAGFTNPRFQGERGEPMNLTVSLRNTRTSAQDVSLELLSQDGPMDSKEVTIPAGSEQIVSFTVTPFQGGGQAFRLVAKPAGAPEQVDIAAVQVNEPDSFRILYIGGRPSPEYRFIQQAVEAADQIQVEAIIRTGPESFFHLLTEKQEQLAPRDSFPTEHTFFNAYDAVVVDESALAEMRDGWESLRAFVANRGGGLLFTGALEEWPEELEVLLPIVTLREESAFFRRELSIAPAPIFSEIAGGALFNRPHIFLPEELPAFVATEWKRGARPILRPANEQASLMAVQAYGAGRVGWLGSTATWRWRMASSSGPEQHQLFWNNTLVWLASTGKPRITVPVQGARVPLAAPVSASIDVMGSDFRPAREAEVEATVRMPGGETRRIDLQPSFRHPGRFETKFRPDEAGEYKIAYRVLFPEGEELLHEAFFIASHHDTEREETAYREDLLRDITRLTGGEFRHYSDVRSLREIPLAEGVPTRERKRHIAGNPLFLLFLALPLFGEWYIRRRLGLK